MEKQYFVYEWRSIKTHKRYIGSHCGYEDDGYVSSSKSFNKVYNKHPEHFKRHIIYFGKNRNDILEKEKDLLVYNDAANNRDFYNLCNTPGKGWSHHDNPELAQIYYKKISDARKGQPAQNKDKPMSAEQKLKLTDTWEITTPDNKTIVRDNMLAYCKEHNLNPSAMSAVARGNRRHYKGYKCKKITNNRNVEYDYKEWKSKGKSGKALYGSANPFAKEITIDNTTYGSMIEASIATGLSMYKLRKLREKINE